jgi:hypothetical protein
MPAQIPPLRANLEHVARNDSEMTNAVAVDISGNALK